MTMVRAAIIAGMLKDLSLEDLDALRERVEKEIERRQRKHASAGSSAGSASGGG